MVKKSNSRTIGNMKNPNIKPKPKFNYTVLEYDFRQVFPSGNKLGIHLLRLLGISNDLTFLREWHYSVFNDKKDGPEFLMISGRGFFLTRVLCGVFHELLDCLEKLVNDQEFKKLEKDFVPECRFALNRLLEIRRSEDTEFAIILEKTRNQTAFHFDRGVIEQGLNKLRKLSKNPR